MTTIREAILDNIATSLQGIAVASGYNHTVTAAVERAFRAYDEIDHDAMPWVGFWPSGERTVITSFEMTEETMPVNVLAHLAVPHDGDETAFQAACSAAVSKMKRDIIKALMTDILRDNNAIETRPVSSGHSETDEGIPDVESHQGGTVTIKMTFEVLYESSTTGST